MTEFNTLHRSPAQAPEPASSNILPIRQLRVSEARLGRLRKALAYVVYPLFFLAVAVQSAAILLSAEEIGGWFAPGFLAAMSISLLMVTSKISRENSLVQAFRILGAERGGDA